MRVFLEYWDKWFELQPGDTVVGRDSCCPIQLEDEAISRRHLRFRLEPGRVTSEDLMSTNGTRLNDVPLHRQCELRDGDELVLGHGLVVVHILADDDERVPALQERATGGRRKRAERRDPTTAPLATCPQCHHPLPGLGKPCARCEATERPPRERRREPRIRVSLPVRYKSATAHFSSLVNDISLGGAFIASKLSEPPITSCLITIEPEDGPTFSAEGEVRHVMPVDGSRGRPAGFGIKFKTLEYRGRQWIYNAVQDEMTCFNDTSP
jgi:pSer/pThr/pTyr-binding forkhead associated (FHA) protein